MKTFFSIYPIGPNKSGRAVLLFLNIHFLVLALISCENFVEVDAPNSQLVGDVVFNDKATANAAVSDIFSKMRDSGLLTGQASGLSCTLGLYADELDFYQDIGANSFYTNSLSAENGPMRSLWNGSYNIIYAANAVLEGVSLSSLSAEDKDRFLGEALFIRAVMHFYMVNLYGDIPYVTGTDYLANSKVSRKPAQQVYEAVILDLEKAYQLLPQKASTVEKVRPFKATAKALLARVYLYAGHWNEASDAASAILNDPSFVLEKDPNKIFLKGSPGTIWQFSPSGTGSNTKEGNLFIFNPGPPPVVALTKSLVAAFEPGDQRKQYWIKEASNGTGTWYHPYKYKMKAVAGSSTEYSILLRVGEQYLIRSEARARQGDLIGAKQDLDVVRSNAGLPGTAAITQEDILEAVLKERRCELFTELGHRFLDLKRFGMLDAVLSATKPGWNTSDRLWPIPAQELLANPNLNPQNIGY